MIAAGCQTVGPNGPRASITKKWEQFAYPADPFEIADAKCRLWSRGQAQGMYAQGDAAFVAGAQLGNAIGNAMIIHAAYRDCMTIAGWKQGTVTKPAPVIKKKKAS